MSIGIELPPDAMLHFRPISTSAVWKELSLAGKVPSFIKCAGFTNPLSSYLLILIDGMKGLLFMAFFLFLSVLWSAAR
jgi:hypothetical protein